MTDIEKILSDYAATQEKTWGDHDRRDTCGASEIFGCIRRLWYAKHDVPEDEQYIDGYGAKMRGNLIEDHYLVPAFKGHLPNGLKIISAGTNQSTRANGFLSATPDGILINESSEPHTFEGVTLEPGDSALIEFKSIDPRVNLDKPKPQHVGQTQVQIGLVRQSSNHKPRAAILVYVDASFLDKVTTFAIDWDENVFETARARAHEVFSRDDINTLAPEGAIAGGKECDYCSWAYRCRGDVAARVPDGQADLTDDDRDAAHRMAVGEREMKTALENMKTAHAAYVEEIKQFMLSRNTRRIDGDGWGLSWTTAKGRKTISKALIEEAGLDPEDYMTEGKPGDKLTVTMKQETEK